MSKNEEIYLSGKCRWVRIESPNQWGDYKFDLYPDPTSLNKIMELKGRGLMNKLRNEEDGPCMSFKRPAKKTMRNHEIVFGPPIILDKDGAPTLRAVGDGSDVICKLTIYPFKSPRGTPAVAARWESIKVVNLVPFSPNQFTEQQERTTRGLAEQKLPEHNF
jgi:hypothetical protein